MGPNKVVSPVFSKLTQPFPIPASFSQPKTAGYPSLKRTFNFIGSIQTWLITLTNAVNKKVLVKQFKVFILKR